MWTNYHQPKREIEVLFTNWKRFRSQGPHDFRPSQGFPSGDPPFPGKCPSRHTIRWSGQDGTMNLRDSWVNFITTELTVLPNPENHGLFCSGDHSLLWHYFRLVNYSNVLSMGWWESSAARIDHPQGLYHCSTYFAVNKRENKMPLVLTHATIATLGGHLDPAIWPT